jgi:hypothetical protein
LGNQDPLKQQLLRFLDTVARMKQRLLSPADSPGRNPSVEFALGLPHGASNSKTQSPTSPATTAAASATRSTSQDNLIQTYEERIRSLEKLLQTSYAEARIQERKPDSFEQLRQLEEEIVLLARNLNVGDGQQAKTSKALLLALGERFHKNLAMSDGTHSDTISIRNFAVGNCVLVLPTVRRNVWSIFTVDQGKYYVDPQSMDRLKEGSDGPREWHVGRIIQLTGLTSTGKRDNPFHLPKDCQYYQVHVEPVPELNGDPSLHHEI